MCVNQKHFLDNYYPIDGSVHSLWVTNLFSRRYLNRHCTACDVESDREFRSALYVLTEVLAKNDFFFENKIVKMKEQFWSRAVTAAVLGDFYFFVAWICSIKTFQMLTILPALKSETLILSNWHHIHSFWCYKKRSIRNASWNFEKIRKSY